MIGDESLADYPPGLAETQSFLRYGGRYRRAQRGHAEDVIREGKLPRLAVNPESRRAR